MATTVGRLERAVTGASEKVNRAAQDIGNLRTEIKKKQDK